MSKPNNNTPCPECNGFGMVHDRWTATNEVCPDCNGTGLKSSNQTDNFEAKNGNKESSDAIKTSGRKSEPTKKEWTTICSDHKAHPCPNCVMTLVEPEPHDIFGNGEQFGYEPESEPVREHQHRWTADGVVRCIDCGTFMQEVVRIDPAFNKPEANLTLEPESEIDPTPDLDQIIQQHRYEVEKLPPAVAFGNAKQSLERWATERVVAARIDEVKLWMSKRLEDDYNSSMYGINRINELTKGSK